MCPTWLGYNADMARGSMRNMHGVRMYPRTLASAFGEFWPIKLVLNPCQHILAESSAVMDIAQNFLDGF